MAFVHALAEAILQKSTACFSVNSALRPCDELVGEELAMLDPRTIKPGSCAFDWLELPGHVDTQ